MATLAAAMAARFKIMEIMGFGLFSGSRTRQRDPTVVSLTAR
jgi:hypothetical protein